MYSFYFKAGVKININKVVFVDGQQDRYPRASLRCLTGKVFNNEALLHLAALLC